MRREVDACIDIWTEVLEERYPIGIKYAYEKGSCVKRWNSPIDYVPLLSDVASTSIRGRTAAQSIHRFLSGKN